MQEWLHTITEFFSGESSLPANPDPAHNVLLLQETKKKIETGIFTKLLKRPLVYIFEAAAYSISIVLSLIAFYFWNKIDNIFDTIDTVNFFNRLFNGANLMQNDYSWISYCLLVVMLLPAVIGFLLARLFTKSRKRTAVFIQVENMIDRVIFNLKG